MIWFFAADSHLVIDEITGQRSIVMVYVRRHAINDMAIQIKVHTDYNPVGFFLWWFHVLQCVARNKTETVSVAQFNYQPSTGCPYDSAL
jgi:hypothetical protein